MSAAIAAAATDATTKMSAAIDAAKVKVVDSLPSLPDAAYPPETIIWNNSDTWLYGTDGDAWYPITPDASLLVGQITAGQIAAGAIGADQIAAGAITTSALTVTNFDNLIPNPNSEATAPTGGWPSGAWEAAGLYTFSTAAYAGTSYRQVVGVTGSYPQIQVSPEIPCGQGDQFYFEAMARVWQGSGDGSGSCAVIIEFLDASLGHLVWYMGNTVPLGAYSKSSVASEEAPATTAYVRFFIGSRLVKTGDWALFDNLYARRMADANLLVDGTVTASKVAAGAITASKLTLTDTTNICGNGSGATGTDGWSGSLTDYQSYYVAGQSSILATSRRDALYGLPFAVRPGETYSFGVWCCRGNLALGATAPAGAFNVGFILGTEQTFVTSPTWVGTANPAPTSSPAWVRVEGQVTIPSGYSVARIWVQINASDGSTGTWAFTGLVVRKAASAELLVDGSITAQKITATAIQTTNYAEDGSGNPTAGAKLATGATALKVASANLQVGGYVFTDYFYRQLQALDGSASNGRVLYRGNNDVTYRGGAPNISCLSVTRRNWNSSAVIGTLELALQPGSTTDNLDAMRYARIDMYLQDTAGTSAGLTSVGTYYVPIPDRLYANTTTDSDSANAAKVSFYLSVVGSGWPACIVTLYNAYGASAGNCFYTDASYAIAMVNNGSAFPSGLTVGGSAPPSGGDPTGGGSTGGGCPAPWVEITLASGVIIHAGELYDGAEVQGISEYTLGPAVGIVRNPRRAWRPRVPVILTDGRAPEFSLGHRLLTDTGWVTVEQLTPGQQLLGPQPGTVQTLGTTRLAEIIDFTVDGCHTYVSGGVVSHNVKMLPL